MLIECPQCDSPVSSNAAACPQCKRPMATGINPAAPPASGALIACPACKATVSNQAPTCPKCGQPIASILVGAAPPSVLQKPIGCGPILLLGFFAFLALGYCAKDGAQPQRTFFPHSNEAMAEAMLAVLAEPLVLSTHWLPTSLEVRVRDDGSERNGYAMYLCGVLREKGTARGMTVRVVDDALRSRTLGSYACDNDTR